ncbi:MAG: Kae1-associated kinase Bud32 [Promethearchaeota archaeon]
MKDSWMPINGRIIKKGAEAILVVAKWLNEKALYKIRIKKKYRHPKLDNNIRRERTITEARILDRLLQNDIPVPTLLEVDLENACIIMELIEGQQLKNLINDRPDDDRLGNILEEVGFQVARMHELGVIHGDLTTSNLICLPDALTRSSSFKFIDFGLSRYSVSVEDISVDIHLFKRVISSTHADQFELLYPAFLNGYRRFMKNRNLLERFEKISRRIEVIESRGRYVKKEERK